MFEKNNFYSNTKMEELVKYLVNGGRGTIGKFHRDLKICSRTLSRSMKVLREKKIVMWKNNHSRNNYFISKEYFGRSSEDILKLISGHQTK